MYLELFLEMVDIYVLEIIEGLQLVIKNFIKIFLLYFKVLEDLICVFLEKIYVYIKIYQVLYCDDN